MTQKEPEIPEGLIVYTLRGFNYADLKAECLQAGLTFKIAADLENELLQDRSQNRSHTGLVAYYPHLFLPDSGNRALVDQGEMVISDVEKLRGRLRLKGDIGRFTEYGEIILEEWKKGIKLMEKGKYPYLSARTRTRVFPDNVGPQNYVADIGPLDPDGLCVHVLSRDEKDPEVGAWPLLYLKNNSIR